jgi:hypothetical protein
VWSLRKKASKVGRGLLNRAVDETESAANVEETMMRYSRYGWDLFWRRTREMTQD